MAATQNVVSSLVGKYNESLAEVSGKVYGCIGNLLFGDKVKDGIKANKVGEAGGGDNKSGEQEKGVSGIVIQSSVKEMKRFILNDSEKMALGFIFSERVFERYSDYNMNCEQSPVLLLMFLIFIMAIRQRKGIGDVITASLQIKRKTRISA
jgi:hypothetical protein